VDGMSVPRYTTTTDEPVSGAAGAPPVDPLAESIIYMSASIADQPRAIDRYIDYFGERRNTPSSAVASGPAVSNHEATTPIGKACVP
jgi:hypothetical protein